MSSPTMAYHCTTSYCLPVTSKEQIALGLILLCLPHLCDRFSMLKIEWGMTMLKQPLYLRSQKSLRFTKKKPKKIKKILEKKSIFAPT